MFQVAFALGISDKYNVKIDYIRKKKFAHEDIDMFKVFKNLHIEEATSYEIRELCGEDTFFNKILRRFPFISKSVIYPFDVPYIAERLQWKRDVYLIGTFQSEQFFYGIKNKIKKIFEFPQLEDDINIAFGNALSKENSVAIHVRKGQDYMKDILQNTCDVMYYEKSIQYIREHVEAPRFYVFTDNKEWVKDNLKGFKYEIIDWNPTAGPKNYLDMQLMSLAKHNIIANSTYSWWSAWLNNNKDKIVVAPLHWYNPKMKNLQNLGIVPQNWIKL